jgi:hypothetical protein
MIFLANIIWRYAVATQPNPNSSSQPDEEQTPRLRQRPTKTLPTDRISFTKQLDLLRAWAAASTPAGAVVSNDAVAEMMKMNPSTISLANPFFASIGLLAKAEGGYIPSADVIAFHRAAEYSDTPAHKLAPLMRASWFGMALLPKLGFRPMQEREALQVLHDVTTAGVDYRGQLKMLIDYMVAAGVAQRDGEMVKAAKPCFEFGGAPEAPNEALRPQSAPDVESPAAPRNNVATAFAASPEGGISFHISVRVNMDQFADWEPERIKAFFGGIAQMLAAKAAVEKGN